MTDEEKKAIKDCDTIFICLDDYMSKEIANDYKISYLTLTNLIEKQSKEIEELREEKAKRQWVRIKENGEVEPLFYVSKNEIKAIIEDILNSENSEAIEKLIEWQAHLENDFPTTITKEELEKRWKG